MAYDLDALRRDNPVSSVVGRYVKLRKNGPEFDGLCPFHNEKSPSFTVNDAKGFAHCFGCGYHGDQFDFIMRIESLEFPQACERLGATPSGARPVQSPKSEQDPEPALEPVEATDDDLPRIGEAIKVWNPKRQSWPSFIPAGVYVYRNDIGGIIGAVIRVDTSPGHKITPQIRLVSLADGTITWALHPFDRPRPLYGLETLDAFGEVWVLEGEKKADRARDLGYQAIAWPGGSNGHTHVDWTPLKGRDLLLWPDNDEPGWHCMTGRRDDHDRWHPGIAELAQAARLRIIPLDPDKPKGWDICDCDDPAAYVERHVRDFETPQPQEIPRSGEAANLPTPRQPTQGSTGPGPSKPSPADGNAGADEHPKPKRDDGPTISGDDDGPRHADEDAQAQGQEADERMPDGDPSDRAHEHDDSADTRPRGNETRNGHAVKINGFSHPSDQRRPDGDAPFRTLGHERGIYYYLPNGTQQVVAITAPQHTQAQMVSMAPLEYWERAYEGKNSRAKFDVAAAENAMVRHAEGIGIFTPDKLRGRGAWIDAGRPVMHLGPEVFIDDVGYKPSRAPSSYIYEAAAPLHLKKMAPATTEEAHHLVNICNALSWENPLSAQILAGWCVIAPICGALEYRPHIWVTGPSTAGKTTVIKAIVGRVVGPFAVRRDGTTTEAHLRQTLFHDARPVILDEAESNDKIAAMRMRALLELSRISSDGGTIGKGGKDGQAVEYTVRACFCYSSINVAIAEYADDSRISRLVLKRRDDQEAGAHFKALSADIAKYLTEDYAAKMFARSVANLPTLLKNVRVFSDACAGVLGSRRAADQIGTLLAGLYLCHSTKEIGYEAAVKWVKEKKWGDHTALDAMKDEERLLAFIMTHRRKLTTGKGIRELTIGELIEIGVSGAKQDDVDSADANRELGRIGIKIDCRPNKAPMFIIANRSPELARILDGKPWANDWKRALRSLGGEAVDTTYFTYGLSQRGMILPVEMIRG